MTRTTLSKCANVMGDAENVRLVISETYKKSYRRTAGILSPSCREHNEVRSKLGAQIILRAILGLEIDTDRIPRLDGPWSTTIVEASRVRQADGVQIELDG
jgi:hypothetical protein